MNATQQVDTETTAFVLVDGKWRPVMAPGGYPEKWFCTATLEETQALISAEVRAMIFHPRPILIITREINGGAK